MSKCAAVFLCLAFGVATVASAANVPVAPAKKAAPTAAPAATTGVKAPKTEGSAARGTAPVSAPEAFGNPYETPLLLNAKPLAVGRP